MSDQNDRLRETFSDPPREFGAIPFWFWNDDLDDGEIVRQIRQFHASGFGGFIPHARIGLSRRVGYLTEQYFRIVRLAVEEAHRLGMKVVLYDEGSYPSGSAQGQVVRENPEFAARCIIPQDRTVVGPATGYWRPSVSRAMQDRLISVVAGRETAPGAIDPATLVLLDPDERGLARYEVGAGTWRLMAVWDVYSGGTIRGVYDEEDDGHALAPPAADLMDPDAVASFIRLTHERYYEHLGEHFGTTVLAMFSDEPNPLGRGPRRGPDPWPYTRGFPEDVQGRWDDDVRLWLPALWRDCGPRTEAFRRTYDRAVHDRLERVFYGMQSVWCEQHGIALTGHPGKSNEMGSLRDFHWPGQDMVWRWVVPNSPTALEGPNSVAPKAASSAALIARRRRNASEALGAYGWRLTLDEAKWLLDWHLVRGNNLFFPHACFYSVRGRRAFESEPDIALHNVWWPHLPILLDYLRRISWLLTDGRQIVRTAILTDPNDMAWEAAKHLFQAQIDFLYVDEATLAGARIEAGHLLIGDARIRAVVCDPQDRLSEDATGIFGEFRAKGGFVLETWSEESLVADLSRATGRGVEWRSLAGGQADLRVIHCQKAGRDCYLFVNEGESLLAGELSLAARGAVELWDPLDGSTRPWPARPREGRTRTVLRLERRQGLILAVDPKGEPDPDVGLPVVPGEVVAEVPGPWRAWDSGGRQISVPCPGDWSRVRQFETFAGELRFTTEFTLSDAACGEMEFLDLGVVGDIAEVFLNDRRVGVRAWSPYVFGVQEVIRRGANRLEVRVTNSMANRYDGLQMPSGIIGPVALRGASAFPSGQGEQVVPVTVGE